jgi:undecaprenyl pyrophosphate synthase
MNILIHYHYIHIDFEKLPPKVRSSVEQLEKATAECTGFLVNICLSYGSRYVYTYIRIYIYV